jgi:hypothetical protein
MSLHTTKIALIFSADLPSVGGAKYGELGFHESSLANALQSLKDQSAAQNTTVKLYYVLMDHPAISDGYGGDFESRVYNLSAYFSEKSDNHLSIELIRGSSSDEVVNKILGTVLLDQRKTVLAQ